MIQERDYKLERNYHAPYRHTMSLKSISSWTAKLQKGDVVKRVDWYGNERYDVIRGFKEGKMKLRGGGLFLQVYRHDVGNFYDNKNEEIRPQDWVNEEGGKYGNYLF